MLIANSDCLGNFPIFVPCSCFFSRYMIRDFLSLLFPRLCTSCNNELFTGEEAICTRCRYQLPKTDFHLYRDNPVARHFWGRCPFKHAAAFLYFRKGGKVQRMIHRLKYRNQRTTGILLGRLYGAELLNVPAFRECEIIVPVPLHRSRLVTRGYNQSELFAAGLGEAMSLPVISDVLVRTSSSSTQTKRSRFHRWENVKNIFEVTNTEPFRERHILLVDDVITTGATLEACAHALMEVETIKISAAAIAFTSGNL